jgi:hypothetical protein
MGSLVGRISGMPKADMPSLPPPAFRERRHRGLARRLVAVRRRGVLVLSECERPEPRLAYLCGGRLGLNLRAASAAEAGLMPMCQGMFS